MTVVMKTEVRML